MIRQIPNGLTGLRLIFSIVLLFLPAESRLFWICYGLCGLSDMLDGFLARRLGTETHLGAAFDSCADGAFGAACLLRLGPRLRLAGPVWGLIALTAAVKLLAALRRRSLAFPHTAANRLTGLTLFFVMPICCFHAGDVAAALTCGLALAAALTELQPNHPSKEES